MAPCSAARQDSTRLSRMNGYASKLSPPMISLSAIHAPRNSSAKKTKVHEPMPLRILSAARSPKVSWSASRTAGCACHEWIALSLVRQELEEVGVVAVMRLEIASGGWKYPARVDRSAVAVRRAIGHDARRGRRYD